MISRAEASGAVWAPAVYRPGQVGWSGGLTRSRRRPAGDQVRESLGGRFQNRRRGSAGPVGRLDQPRAFQIGQPQSDASSGKAEPGGQLVRGVRSPKPQLLQALFTQAFGRGAGPWVRHNAGDWTFNVQWSTRPANQHRAREAARPNLRAEIPGARGRAAFADTR